MKPYTCCGILLLLAVPSLPLAAQTITPSKAVSEKSPYTVVERGPHHRVWQRIIERKLPGGRIIQEKHSYREMATGMHFMKAGQWVESQESIEILADGAAAMNGPHQVVFQANANTIGATTLWTPDGKQLKSRVLGLAFSDSATGRSVLIAELKDSNGELHPPNQIWYPDAFTDGVQADLRYTYKRGSFEQDIIVRSGLPDPSDFDLNPETSSLQIYTEFFDTEAPRKQNRQRAAGVDETLHFGSMQAARGKAFTLGESSKTSTVSVVKTWEQRQGRSFLIESVPYHKVAAALKSLPKHAALPKAEARVKRLASVPLSLPPLPTLAARKGAIKLAALSPPRAGYVLDYELNSYETNLIFASSGTFVISGPVHLVGCVFQGGAVLKYAQGVDASLLIDDPGAIVQTTGYRMILATAVDDDTVGEPFYDSTGSPSGYYASPAIDNLYGASPAWENMRFLYADVGIQFRDGCNPSPVRHCQFVHCNQPIVDLGNNVTVQNVLMSDVATAFYATNNSVLDVWHLTVDQCGALTVGGQNSRINLTNSLLVGVANTGPVTVYSNAVASESSSNGVFTAVAGGFHYLVDDSTNRAAGITNIPASLLSGLRSRTTYAPVVLTTIAGDAVLAPTAPRGASPPDIGYAYPALDYFGSGITVASNVTVLLTNGAALAMDYSQSPWGIILNPASFISQGNPLVPNHIVRAHMVQEQSSGNPGYQSVFYDGNGGGNDPNFLSQVRLRFTEFGQLNNDLYVYYTGRGINALEVSHSSFYNPCLVVDTSGANPLVCGITNTLWQGGAMEFGLGYPSPNAAVDNRNNLFKNFTFLLAGGTTNWTVCDNLFDTSYVTDYGTPVGNSYNAYYNTENVLSITNETGLVPLATLAYQAGPLGAYYLPTNSLLINAGSCYAANLGLYHFTTTTNQVKEGSTRVDISLHYVAIDPATGLPYDTDGDGIPDYFEDSNGNGVLDSALLETDWQTYTTITNNVPGLQVFTPLK